MFTPNSPEHYQSGVTGPMPTHWQGTNAVDGDASDFAMAAPGSTYTRSDLTNQKAYTFTKQKNDALDLDWGGLMCIAERVTRSQFTDGGAAAGTYALKTQIPVGAFVLRTLVQDVTGFTGNTSATLIIGDGTDTDRYNTGTPSVFTTANQIVMGAPSGTLEHTAAATVTLTVTGNSDFTAINAGALTIKIYYLI